MKKSNILLLSFIASVFIVLLVVHVALSAKFKKGEFVYDEPVLYNDLSYDSVALPAFSKLVILDSSETNNNHLDIHLDSNSNNVLSFRKNEPISFQLNNDTLFIRLSKSPSPAGKIVCSKLDYIRSAKQIALVSHTGFGELNISSSADCFFAEDFKAAALHLQLSKNAHADIKRGGRIGTLSLDMNDEAFLETDNCFFQFGTTRFAPGTKIILGGTSLQAINKP